MEPIYIAAFYKFTPLGTLEECREWQQPLKQEMLLRDVRGTITLSPEGVNATISGTKPELFGMLEHLQANPLIGTLSHKLSQHNSQPFMRSKVRVKRELISLGEPVNTSVCVGTYVSTSDWNALISRPDVLTIDTRNAYEYRIGRFKGALNPDTRNFKETIAFTRQHLDQHTHKAVAMYCTGGIRCEKYSSYLLQLGFENVFHLNGGILQYLEDIPAEESLWEGSCFVFDDRVAVTHALQKDERITMCEGCGSPLTPTDRAYEEFFAHKRCGYCETANHHHHASASGGTLAAQPNA